MIEPIEKWSGLEKARKSLEGSGQVNMNLVLDAMEHADRVVDTLNNLLVNGQAKFFYAAGKMDGLNEAATACETAAGDGTVTENVAEGLKAAAKLCRAMA